MQATESQLRDRDESGMARPAGHGKRGARRGLEDDVRSAQTRFDIKSLLIEHMLVALQVAGQHSENFARMKLSKREIWDLYEENQSHMLIILGISPRYVYSTG